MGILTGPDRETQVGGCPSLSLPSFVLLGLGFQVESLLKVTVRTVALGHGLRDGTGEEEWTGKLLRAGCHCCSLDLKLGKCGLGGGRPPGSPPQPICLFLCLEIPGTWELSGS